MRNAIAAIFIAALAGYAYADVVVGDGRVVTQGRKVPAFSSISVEGSGTLKVHRGGQKVELVGDSNVLPYVTTTVSGSELRISFKPFTSVMSVTKLEYDISLPELSGISLAGSGDAYVDAFSGEAFRASIAGSGGMKASLGFKRIDLTCAGSGGFDTEVKSDDLRLRCSGSGDAFIKGTAGNADIAVSGSGSIGARDLAAERARVVISGSGRAEIRAVNSLDVSVSGSGDVKYWGDPSVTQRINGSGRVSKAGK